MPDWQQFSRREHCDLCVRFLVHTLQAFGGAITATSVNLKALEDGQLTVDDPGQLLIGIIVQTLVLTLATWRARRRENKARDRRSRDTPVSRDRRKRA